MREVNFSIPNVNKASVGITTALYDRRALDCTSTLPLINSLNHLAYLTTSSARIRDILTIDGGVERLVCLLKSGRSKDPMDMWKWNLAFQCVVNVGVRGSENVRTRVVEADLIPVIATILDNYIKVFDRCREKAEEALQAKEQRFHSSRTIENQSSTKETSFGTRVNRSQPEARGTRRHPPPPSLEISTALTTAIDTIHDAMEITSTAPQPTVSSPLERSVFPTSRRQHHQRTQDTRQHFVTPSRHSIQPLVAAVPSMDAADGFSIRPVRDVDRLPSMVVGVQSNISQPDSPTTPLPSNLTHSMAVRSIPTTNQNGRIPRRPNLRHQTSLSTTEDSNIDSPVSDEPGVPEISGDSRPAIQSPINVDIQEIDMDENDSLITDVESQLGLNPATVSDTQDVANFNLNHRFALNGSVDNTALQTGPNLGFLPVGQTMINILPAVPFTNLPRFSIDRPPHCHILTAMPRDEDILMSLQLLAYVSKYCNLRPYFQKSHLVPKLKIGAELKLLDIDEGLPFTGCSVNSTSSTICTTEENEEEEYLLPDDFNIFPLVEKFTIRHHTQDMQYWAGVVMRNLCRKDDSRGGIRQCAHYQCGKWEETPRQFAKCRRCRRTKYCSKECQKSAWIFHRHWCVAATP